MSIQTGRLTPQADFELDTFTVVVLYAGPRAAEYDPAETQRLLNEHLQYTLGLRRAGHLLAAGAILDDDPPAERLTGLGFSHESAAELLPLLNEDPAVKAGLEAVKIVTYMCPKGAITFQRSTREGCHLGSVGAYRRLKRFRPPGSGLRPSAIVDPPPRFSHHGKRRGEALLQGATLCRRFMTLKRRYPFEERPRSAPAAYGEAATV